MRRPTKTEKDTAKALIFVKGATMDMLAFDEVVTLGLLTEEECETLIKELQNQCEKELAKLGRVYGAIPRGSTLEIVDHIMFEDMVD